MLSWTLKGLCGGLAAELSGMLAKALGLSGPQVLLQYHRLKHPPLKVLIFDEDRMLLIFEGISES